MKNRVRIPRQNATDILNLAKKVYAKHQADGANSELKLLNWDAMAAQIEEAQQLHDEVQTHRMEMRRRIQTRSAKLLAISTKLRDSRDVLTGLHKTEMRSLEQWGFDVLDPRATAIVPAPEEKKRAVVHRDQQIPCKERSEGFSLFFCHLFRHQITRNNGKPNNVRSRL